MRKPSNPTGPSGGDEAGASLLTADLDHNLSRLKEVLQGCADVVWHDFRAAGSRRSSALYLMGMVNLELLDRQVLSKLKAEDKLSFGSVDDIREGLPVSSLEEASTIDDVVRGVLESGAVVLIDGLPKAISVGLAQFDKRAIEEPQAESVVRGSRDGFIETLDTNLSLIRRRLRTPALKYASFTVGKYSKTKLLVGYLDGIVNPDVLAEVKERISRIDIDGVPDSGTIEEWIEGDTYSPFPQVQTTERPDVATAALLEGRVVILTENTPIALLAPTTFWTLLQSSEDYNERFLIGTLIRWLRYLYLVVALLAPSLYVAVLTFHHEMVPTTLLLRVARSREEIPFPAWMEAFIMEITFEALREAGVRLPKQIGSAVSIVGALVIGQAAIQAGIVSAPMVMIVAITGISSFMLPQYSLSVSMRMLRFPIMILSGIIGLYGLVICVLVIISHLCILKSFGVPYLAPIAPITPGGFKDSLIRAPLKKMKFRPTFYAKGDLKRNGGTSEDPA